MVGSTIPYSPFERAVTLPKLNSMQYCYGVGSNFITGVPPEFEDFLTLKLCMKPKFNDPKCVISKQGFTRSNLPDQICNETSIHMQMTKQRPFLEAQNFHHKLQILLEVIIGCKTSSDTRWSHDYLQYDHCAYHCIAAFNGVIEPQQDGGLHWHIMLYSCVLSPLLLKKQQLFHQRHCKHKLVKCWTVSLVQLYQVKYINGTMIYLLQLNMVVNVLGVLI
jgi:hypothetical protein